MWSPERGDVFAGGDWVAGEETTAGGDEKRREG